MAATADIAHVWQGVQNAERNAYPMAAEKFWGGIFVGIDASTGNGRKLQAGDLFAGINLFQLDNSGGSAGDKTAEVQTGCQVELAVGSSAATDVGAIVYASDENTATKTASTNTPIGVVRQYLGNNRCLVKLWTIEEQVAYAAGIA